MVLHFIINEIFLKTDGKFGRYQTYTNKPNGNSSFFATKALPHESQFNTSIQTVACITRFKLEQLERLRSEMPPAASWLPLLMIHIRSQVKRRQSQGYKFKKKTAKNSNFLMLQETLHETHLLKLPDKMYKYEMDPTRSVGAREQTRDAGQTDRRTDGRSDTNIPTPPQQLCCAGV